MNRTPATIYQYYGTEADARGGRFTRKCAKSSIAGLAGLAVIAGVAVVLSKKKGKR